MYLLPTRPYVPTLADLDAASLGLHILPEATPETSIFAEEYWFIRAGKDEWVLELLMTDSEPDQLPPTVEALFAGQAPRCFGLFVGREDGDKALELIRRLARVCGGVVYDDSGDLGTRGRMWSLTDLESARYLGMFHPPSWLPDEERYPRAVVIHPRTVPGLLSWGDIYRLMPHGAVFEGRFAGSAVGWEDLLQDEVFIRWGDQGVWLKKLSRVAAFLPHMWSADEKEVVQRAMYRGAPAFSVWTHRQQNLPLLLLVIARLQELVDGRASFRGRPWGVEPTEAEVTWGLLRELGSELPTEPGPWREDRWAAYGGVRFDEPLSVSTTREELPGGNERESDLTLSILPTANRRTTVADVRAAFPDAKVYDGLRRRSARSNADLFMVVVGRGETSVTVSRSLFGGMPHDLAATDLGPRDLLLVTEAMAKGAPTHTLYVVSDEPGGRELALDLAAWLAERYAGYVACDDPRLTGRAGWPHRAEELRQMREGMVD